MGKYQIIRSCCAVISICLGLAACSNPPEADGGILFNGEREAIPGLNVDTGYQPEGASVQVKLALSSGGALTAVAKANGSDSTLTPIAGTGQYALAASIKAEASVKIDYSGIKYEGVLKQIEITIPSAKTTFEPFSIDTKALIATDVPEIPLPSIPLAGVPGAGGTLDLTVSGHIDSTFSGVCATARDGVGQFTGKTATSGKLDIKATVNLTIPGIGTKSFGPFPISVNIPALEVPLDLGQRNLADGTPAMVSPSPCEASSPTCTCASGEVCIDGKCGAPPTCNATNCFGCCQGNTCVAGDTAGACGEDGIACQACGSGQGCVNGRCSLGCSFLTCNGCCDASGNCRAGNSDSACGFFGGACSSCSGGSACKEGTCVNTTCSTTCGGCCDGVGACKTGTAMNECGAMGNACVGCGSGRSCVSGRCEILPSSLWDFVVESVTVEPYDCSGVTWDSFGGLPDPYVIVTVGTGTGAQQASSSSVSNSLSATFNQKVLTSLSAGLVRSGIGLTVYDYDGIGDDLLASEAFATPTNVFDGVQTRKFGKCPGSSPVTVYYRLAPH